MNANKKSSFVKVLCIVSFLLQSIAFCYAADREPKVYRKGNEIIIENLALLGKYDQSKYDWTYGITWEKADKLIYKSIKSVSYDYLWVVVIPTIEDKYGNIKQEKPIAIGKVDVREGKRYVDYDHWRYQFQGTYRMWMKDLEDFEKRYEEEAIKQYKGKKYHLLDFSKEAHNYWITIRERAKDLQSDYYRPKSIR